jgi:exonuclease VII large subunit
MMKTAFELSRLENALTNFESIAENNFLSLLNEMEPALHNKQREVENIMQNIAQLQQSSENLPKAITEKKRAIKALQHQKIKRGLLVALGILAAAGAILGGYAFVAGILFSDAYTAVMGFLTVIIGACRSFLLFEWSHEYATNTSTNELKVELNALRAQFQQIKPAIEREKRHLSQIKNTAKQEVNQLTDQCYDFFTQRKMPQQRKSLIDELEKRDALNLVA